MNPTQEQIAQWAREAEFSKLGVYVYSEPASYSETLALNVVTNLVTRAMAAQAEADAVLCAQLKHNRMSNIEDLCAAAIRANAPKVAA